ncbi:MAG TPA: alanine--glyoxylate aminotransferase family protein [Longimicrobiales bacterium]|nr:alanine--glyoxylate aminotransferase family protein [Longimicrobiales bacterium]
MTTDDGFGRFFLPGPTEVRPEILRAQIGPMVGHRTPDTERIVERLQRGLRGLFGTDRPVYIAPSSATGLMEAAIRNGVRRKVLCLVNGAFSERFAKIARACGLEPVELAVDWGEAHTPEMVAEALDGGGFDAVTVVHCETSTGVLNPVEEIAAVAHEAGDVVVLVDGVTSVAGMEIHADAWGLDFILTGSQKALALPPGLALGVAQPGVLERAAANEARGLYFDFLAFEKNLEQNQTPTTPAVSLLYALSAQLDAIEREGVGCRAERHRAMASALYGWVEEARSGGIDVSIVAPEGYRSTTVTCLRPPAGWTGPEVQRALAERGFTIAPGYGRFKDEMFRIGHMGDHTVGELQTLLDALEEVLRP